LHLFLSTFSTTTTEHHLTLAQLLNSYTCFEPHQYEFVDEIPMVAFTIHTLHLSQSLAAATAMKRTTFGIIFIIMTCGDDSAQQDTLNLLAAAQFRSDEQADS
jgi:hypothetical protein